ncbi:Uncharacterised protein [Gallibacterium anatis]|uniref:Uncharacterized protein n=1 Tax=Gallibacterium anatis TaxID=750 RepID=A0A377H729_9PAST|nr:DUF5420 family protein [Gallibacterium anatis]KGQ56594.1 hypothetical protein IE01_06505 [Gallibacterium anatis DSM 16844 = F 149]STO38148.1 Uncharacterised protein [Gallibacterium anatis]
MEYRYFKGNLNAEPLKTLNEDWLKRFKERNKKLKAIFDTMPFYDGWYGGEEFISGIVCDSDNPHLEQLKQTKGYKLTLCDSQDRYIVRPDKRYKIGKELDKALCNVYQILLEYPPFGKFITKQLGINRMVLDGRSGYLSSAGVCKKVLLVCIPVKGQGCSGDDFPAVPDSLTEIKESEFLAIQGK